MIAKRIMTPKGGSGFERLAAYVVNAKRGIDPASWERLGAYILDANGQGEKVAWSRVTNCANTDPGWAVKEIMATQGRNTRSRSDKSYHLVVSFPEGERPSREQMEEIEDRLVEAIGFADHQRISAVHQNTDNWHLHVAVNKVHPTTFRNVAPFQDHFRLQQACAELEVKLGLTREEHTTEPQKGRGRDKARAREAQFHDRNGGPSFAAWIREHAAPSLLAAKDRGQGWQTLHKAAGAYDLVLKPRGAGLVISHRGDGRLHVKASDIDRGLSLTALSRVLGPYEPPSAEAAVEAAQARYSRPKQASPLYAAFQTERESALRERKDALARLRARQIAYGEELERWYRDRLKRERLSGLTGHLRHDSFRHINEQRQRDREERKAREAEERKRVRAKHQIPAWANFLKAEASKGNAAARTALERREGRSNRQTPENGREDAER